MAADKSGDEVLAGVLRGEGLDELQVAVRMVSAPILWGHEVQVGRKVDPATFPGYVGDGDAESVARQVVAVLLNIGWTMPVMDS